MSSPRGGSGRWVTALLISTLVFCTVLWAQNPDATKSATQVTIYQNGRIYTNDAGSPWAEAMLVRGDEILATGDDDEVAALADKGAQVVDLEKHFVMPGFNDAHVHLG